MADNEEVIIEAATNEEALLKAEEIFKIDRDLLDIEYISTGSSGFMGMGRKAVKIHVNKHVDVVKEEPQDENIKDYTVINGSITITAGKVIVQNPQGFGKYPNIIGSENVDVLVNGYKIKKSTFISSEDEVEVVTRDVTPKAALEIELSDDKMKAYLIIKKQVGKKFSIVDDGPALNVKVCANIEEIEPVITLDEVKNLLLKNNVVYGVNEVEILKTLNSDIREIEVEVACGLPPEGEEECKIIFSFLDDDNEERPINPHSDGKIYSVQVGEILARKYVPEIKKNGIDVTGQEVPFKEKEIIIGEGVALNKNGTIAVAAIPGRPVLEGDSRKILSVRPIYFIGGDVDAEVGNVKFTGDIYVSGDVLEGYKLETRGSIQVRGNARFSTLYANRDIFINKKIFTTEVQAGVIENSYKRINPELNRLMQRIENLFFAIVQLKRQKVFTLQDFTYNVDGQLVQLLLDYKYKDIPLAINRLTKALKNSNDELSGEVAGIIKLLNEKLCNLGPLRIQDKNEIKLLIQELEGAIDYIKFLSKQKANVVVDYAQNSRIRASGDIIVTGEACLFSILEAGSCISIPNGIVRGGSFTAREKIEISELGSLSNSQINIKLLGNCVLKADKINSFVVIRHGAQKHIVDRPCRQLIASADDEGNLFVTAVTEG